MVELIDSDTVTVSEIDPVEVREMDPLRDIVVLRVWEVEML